MFRRLFSKINRLFLLGLGLSALVIILVYIVSSDIGRQLIVNLIWVAFLLILILLGIITFSQHRKIDALELEKQELESELLQFSQRTRIRTDEYLDERTRQLSDLNEKLIEEIDERRKSENHLRQFSSIVEQSASTILITDLDGTIQFVNPAFTRVTGYSVEEAIGQTTNIVKSGMTPRETYTEMWKTIAQGKAWQGEFINRKKSGELYWEYATIAPVKNEDGEVISYVAVKDDITALKKTEQKLRESEGLYRSLVTASPDSIGVADLNGTIRFMSPSGVDLFGYESEQDFIGKHMLDFIVPEQREQVIGLIDQLQQGQVMRPGEYQAIKQDGTRISIETNVEFVRNESGAATGIVVVSRDISARKNLETAEREQRQLVDTLHRMGKTLTATLEIDQQLDLILDLMRDVIPYTTANLFSVEGDSARLIRQRGYNNEKWSFDQSHLMDISSFKTVKSMLKTLRPLAIPDIDAYPDWRSDRPQGHIKSWVGAPIVDDNHPIAFLMLNHTEKGFYKHRHAEILGMFAAEAAIALHNARLYDSVKRMATTDSLTGVNNRRSFFEQADTLLKQSIRYNHPLSVILLDIDHFKEINDTYGHQVGDKALLMVAQTIRNTVREIDIVARYGGEEFVVLMPETNAETSSTVAERIRFNIAQSPIPTADGDFFLTASAGVSDVFAVYPPDIQELLRRADKGLYQAKAEGRNRVVFIE